MAPRQPTPPSSHYASQAGLAVAFARLLKAHPNLPRTDLYALLTRFSQASAVLAATDYTDRRRASGIRSSFTVPLAEPPTPEHFAKTLDYAYSDPQAVEQRLEASLTRLAVQAGRTTTVEAVKADPQARAWARETRGDCCYFCALMAARGAVYKDAGAAGRDANEKFTGSDQFKFHNNCHCIAVPVFGVYEKPSDARGWNRQYHDLKRELGRAPSLLEWRNAFETATTNVPQLAGT